MSSPFSIVFAGGGCRSFWSLGAYRALRDRLPRPAEIAGVSAGSAMALAVATDTVDRMLEIFLAKTDANRRNFYPERLLVGRRAFPHEQMYRSTVAQCLEEGGWEQLSTAPRVRILQAFVEPGRPVIRTIYAAVRAYTARRKGGELHGPEAPYDGIGEEVDIAQDAETAADLIDRVLRSSTSPPVTSLPTIEGKTYVDGSVVDAVPVRALSAGARAGRVLVLLTRRYPGGSLPATPNHLYLMPSAPPPIHKWDYTSPDRITDALNAGLEDAKGFVARVDAFLGTSRPGGG